MFFESVILDKCNRTSLNGKTSIKICPHTKTQMVLGTNSSGKSSLIDIGFSPLPPEHHNFDHGGSWAVVVHHKGRVYDLRADYGDKNFYSFIVDGGENLNRGRSITVQYELVKEYMGYTKELHAFLTGRLRFTAMNATQRRDWIARMSANDFTYAFQKYSGYKKAKNAASIVVNWVQGQLADNRTRLMNPDDALYMRQKANELHQTLDVLMREPKHADGALGDFELNNQIEALIREVETFLVTEYPDTLGATDLVEMDRLHSECEGMIFTLRGELTVRGERLAECEQRKVRAEKLMTLPPEELEKSIGELTQQLSELAKPVIDLEASLLRPAIRAITELRLVVNTLPPERKTIGDLAILQDHHYRHQVRLGSVTGLLDSLDRQIDEIHRCQEVACPSCHTSFKPGIAPGKLEELQERVSKGNVIVIAASAEVVEIEEKLQDTSSIIAAYSELEDVRRKYQNDSPGLFIYLDACGWAGLGRQLLEKMALYERDATLLERRTVITTRLDSLQTALATYRQESDSISGALQDYAEAYRTYNELHQRLTELLKTKQRYAHVTANMRKWESLVTSAENRFDNLRSELINYTNQQGDTMVAELIKKTKITLGVHEAALQENETYETLVRDLENQLLTAQTQEEAYKRLVDALCPKSGLIAEQITLQITSILEVANDVIQRIWGYPLYITPGELDDNEVDYKFPLLVDTQPRPDIAAGSSSVKDIVDQAFRMCAYVCMDLTDYPLYLDEFGASFDEAHRHNLIPVLKDLIDDPRFSQVLMISHSLDGQTAFPGAEVIILDDRNISYPHPYNKHVEFA